MFPAKWATIIFFCPPHLNSVFANAQAICILPKAFSPGPFFSSKLCPVGCIWVSKLWSCSFFNSPFPKRLSPSFQEFLYNFGSTSHKLTNIGNALACSPNKETRFSSSVRFPSICFPPKLCFSAFSLEKNWKEFYRSSSPISCPIQKSIIAASPIERCPASV